MSGTLAVPPIAVPKPAVEDFPASRTGIVQTKLHRVDAPRVMPSSPTKPAQSRNIPMNLRREVGSDDDLAALLDEGAIDPAQPPAATAPQDDDGVESILKRFKGTPDEIARQIAKSYAESERTMRQLQNEKAALLSGKPVPPQNPGMNTAQPTSPVAQPAQMAPVTQQVTVNPFDYKKAGSQFLDDIEGTLKSFDEHQNSRLMAGMNQMVQNLMVPMYDELLQMRFASHYPEIVTDDSWPIIKVLASQSEGANDREKFHNGIKKYQKQIMPPSATAGVSGEMADMRAAVQQPSAQASNAMPDKKIYKLSVIRKIMNRPDYGNDVETVRKIELAFEEGRVDRNS